MNSPLNSPAHGGGSAKLVRSAAIGDNRSGIGSKIRRDNKLIGREVKIIQGPLKGYYGIVKDATDNTARVELHADCKTISVDRTRLALVG